MGEYTSKGSLDRRHSSRAMLSRQGSNTDLARSGSRSQLNRAASQSYLTNYSVQGRGSTDRCSGSLHRQSSQSRMGRPTVHRQESKSTLKEREPYRGGNTWKDSLRGLDPHKNVPVWERSTVSKRAKETTGEAWQGGGARHRSNSCTRRSRSQSRSPDRLMRPTYSSRAKRETPHPSSQSQTPARRQSRKSVSRGPRSRTSSVSPRRTQSRSPSQAPRRASSQDTGFTPGRTVRGPVGEGGDPLNNYKSFAEFRASRGTEQSSYRGLASNGYSGSGDRGAPVRVSPVRVSPVRVSPVRASPVRLSTSPVRPTQDWRSSPSSYSKLSQGSDRNTSTSSWQSKTSNSYSNGYSSSTTSYSASTTGYSNNTGYSSLSESQTGNYSSYSGTTADSGYGSWGRGATSKVRDSSSSPRHSLASSNRGGSGSIGLSALKKPVIESWDDDRKESSSSSSSRRGVSSTYIG